MADPSSRPTSPRRAATRARLLEGARQVIAEQGVRGASVEAICDAAGFTRGAFYSNFIDRDELVLALIADDHDTTLTHVEAVFASPPDDPEAIVEAILERLADVDPRQRYLTRTELTLYAVRSDAVRSDFVRLRGEFRSAFRNAIESAAAQQGIALRLDPATLVRTVEALHDGAMAQSLLEPIDLPMGSLQRAVLPRLFLDRDVD